MTSNVFDFVCKSSQGEDISLDSFKGKSLLIVNTASKCGFTPQFKGLEDLHTKYQERGLRVLGFPCNQFGKQDPGANGEILEFCQINYGVSFPIFSKIDVNGDATDPLFIFLKGKAPGALGTKAIKWNFTKFLVDPTGEQVTRFASATKPEQLSDAIEASFN